MSDQSVSAPAAPRTTVEVLQWCQTMDLQTAELVGRWVWVKFDSKPSQDLRDAMKAAGFRWVKTRGSWAHDCGIKSRKGPGDPRDRYGSVPVRELEIAGGGE